MSKVPAVVSKVVESESALTVLGTPMVSITPDSNQDMFPQLKHIHPMAIKPGNGLVTADAWHVGIHDGKTFQKLEANYLMCVLAGRDAVRVLRYPGGVDKAEYDRLVAEARAARTQMPESPEYERAYAKLGDRGSTHEKYIELCKEPTAELGSSMIIILWSKDGATMAEFPLFKTTGTYWRNRLLQAQWKDKLALKVGITNHEGNRIESKAGFVYLDGKKFTQCEVVAIATEKLAEVPELAKKFARNYDAWLGS